ncbi:S-layer homology domain-containing protein, partial [Candidatus Gracilibacteria bacterium]|nr:S-layer homology domain-containing protein [Candidatus Gracilibacteria bacterium]
PTQTFSPNLPITRVQAIVWLVSIRRQLPISGPNYFSDTTNTPWTGSISVAAQKGWIQGTNGLFYPWQPLTRAEAAKVIVNSRS